MSVRFISPDPWIDLYQFGYGGIAGEDFSKDTPPSDEESSFYCLGI